MSVLSKKSKHNMRVATPKLLIALCAVVAVFVVVILVGQSNRQAQISAQMKELEEEYKLLSNEKQRLENMVEYVHSDEYLLQYAREKLGFVKQDDIKFNTGDE